MGNDFENFFDASERSDGKAKYNMSMPFNFLQANLLHQANIAQQEGNYALWFSILNSIYQNASGFFDGKELEQAEGFYGDGRKQLTAWINYHHRFSTSRNKGNYTPPNDFPLLLHNYHVFLSRTLRKHDLIIPMRASGNAFEEV